MDAFAGPSGTGRPDAGILGRNAIAAFIPNGTLARESYVVYVVSSLWLFGMRWRMST